MTRLSLLIPTFNNALTVERTLGSALAQDYRPLEVVAYDEASSDGTRQIIERTLAAAPADVETRFLRSDQNSGPLPAWRRLLHEATGDWSAFVWSDDVLLPGYAPEMMAGAARADEAGRVLVSCSAEVEAGARILPYYATDRSVPFTGRPKPGASSITTSTSTTLGDTTIGDTPMETTSASCPSWLWLVPGWNYSAAVWSR
jgi:glycosyltransferase involved in cell wall biosynthesis